MAEEIDFENGRNSNFEGLVTLTFDPAIRHIVLQQSLTYIPNFIQIEETFCGRTDVRTDVRIFLPSILLGRLSEVDLIIICPTRLPTKVPLFMGFLTTQSGKHKNVAFINKVNVTKVVYR